MPDDESDRITWRNGRVINNIFVPNPVNVRSKAAAPAPWELSLSRESRQQEERREEKSHGQGEKREGKRNRFLPLLRAHAEHHDQLAIASHEQEARRRNGQQQPPPESRDYTYHAGMYGENILRLCM